MGNPLLLLALIGAGYVLYKRSTDSESAADPTAGQNGWKPVDNPVPLTAEQLAPYAKPGIGVKFYLDHVHPSGTAIASPRALANGSVVSVESGTGGVRYWKIKLTAVADDATYGPMPKDLALPTVGAVFALTDKQLFG